MEVIKKDFYYCANIDGIDLELAVRSDFKGDFTPDDFCIVQIRKRQSYGTVTRYKTMTKKELKAALDISPKTKIEIR